MADRPLGPEEVEVLEANAVARGMTIDHLMDNAGHVVAEEAKLHLPPPPSPVGILCGLGNNGGDGLAAASVLAAEGYQPRVWLLGEPSKIRTAAARRRWDLVAGLRYVRQGVPSVSDLKGLPVVVDAMLGSGGKGEPREPYKSAVEALAASGTKVLSVDLPTGLGSPLSVRAVWTVALEVRKQGMDNSACGEVTVRSIGMPPEAHRETGVGEFAFFPIPPPSVRKSDAGRVVVVGGGPYAGAPYLAGMGALRGGADMVFVVVPGGIQDTVQGYSPELIVRGVGRGRAFTSEDTAALQKLVESIRPTALLVGNGLGDAPETLTAVERLLGWALPSMRCAVDADGLRVLPRRAQRPFAAQSPDRLLLTPNRREFVHLSDVEGRAYEEPSEEDVRRNARRLEATLLVKGPTDLISDGESYKLNRTHHPAMVVGGAGDVLAGLSTSLLARGLSPYTAARLSSFWLGRASLEAFDRVSHALLPTDLLLSLGPALKRGLDELRRVTDPGRPARAAHE
ncbi:MAG: NAD(P)H-hydrate dehydratase [Euryarchaeota archaeon]|nr:NAD(P)H-hydrate dehydratase [Euryarchaeota archaeon]MDE1835873.1 NAD(P)H-hydrate dehydratase [Euryarchaeota archaeon]MDE2044449.1 NAD(P)H-hydrate dehydratase [Thermoplasmata archaeon]